MNYIQREIYILIVIITFIKIILVKMGLLLLYLLQQYFITMRHLYQQQHIATDLVHHLIQRAEDIITELNFINKNNAPYCLNQVHNTIQHIVKNQSHNPQQSLKDESQQPNTITFDNLMNAEVQQQTQYSTSDKQVQMIRENKSYRELVVLQSKKVLDNNGGGSNGCVQVEHKEEQIGSVQQLNFIEVLRRHKESEQRQKKGKAAVAEDRKVTKLKGSGKIVFDYDGRVKEVNIPSNTQLHKITPLGNAVQPQLKPQKQDPDPNNHHQITSIKPQEDKLNKPSRKRSSHNFQLFVDQMANSIQLADKKCKMWFDGRQITKIMKKVEGEMMKSIGDSSHITNNLVALSRERSQKETKQEIDSQEKVSMRMKSQLLPTKKERFKSEAGDDSRLFQRIASEKLQEVGLADIKIKPKQFTMKTESNESRPKGHTLTVQGLAFKNNLLPQFEQSLSSASVALNSSHKIRIREVTQENQILNRHISRVRQGFSKINPTEKLPIIIRKQNQIEVRVLERLKKLKQVKMTKDIRLILAEKMLTEVSQEWTKRHRTSHD